MFTGLIESVGRVCTLEHRGQAGVLRLETDLPVAEITLGDSIAVNGACLTVTSLESRMLSFDVSPETLSSTTLGDLKQGTAVNMERALRLGERLDGHIVTGHIDCTATLTGRRRVSGNEVLEFAVPEESLRLVVVKGSVAIDGISLTVNTVSATGFSVNIIPHTASRTTLASLRPGQRVNIETDIIGKYVARLIRPGRSGEGLTLKTLAENGFF